MPCRCPRRYRRRHGPARTPSPPRAPLLGIRRGGHRHAHGRIRPTGRARRRAEARSRRTGAGSAGPRNRGTRNTGTRNTGTRNTGTRNTGTRSTGARAAGTRPAAGARPAALGLRGDASRAGTTTRLGRRDDDGGREPSAARRERRAAAVPWRAAPPDRVRAGRRRPGGRARAARPGRFRVVAGERGGRAAGPGRLPAHRRGPGRGGGEPADRPAQLAAPRGAAPPLKAARPSRDEPRVTESGPAVPR
ncbi:pentapeptide repeat-containing protein [Actinoplanes hulinensis]|uniref:Pentapeptide repeat-containing protein n=1 Tax=Actinoplanes hulinensis TaxID=1144547 RepID=A0ABS7AU11_9ACTN|nr:pentapeptide repeat-containing protein [Actinoplanes hulinensis]